MQELTEERGRAAGAYVQWGPALAGAAAAAATAFVLMSFAAAIGLSFASATPTWRDASAWLAILSGVWILLVHVFSFGLGGYAAGRLRTPLVGADPAEVEFRDGMHGILAWAVGVLIGALMLWASASALSPTRTDRGTQASGAGEPAYLALELDRLFRSENRAEDPNRQASRAEAGRIIAAGLGRQALSNEDRAYLARLVAARTGLPAAEAERRVAQVTESARRAAARAHRSAIIIGFMTAASLLAAAAAAWLAGLAGGRHRDGQTATSLSSLTWRSLRHSPAR